MKSVCQEENYKLLYDNHLKSLRNFLYYKCGDYDVAEDLAQESFIKLWENCSTVIFNSAKSFVFTVGSRLFLNKVRREKVELNFEKRLTVSKDKESPEFLLEEKEFKLKLEQAISSLDVKQREVFLMNRIDGLKYSEIAELLGIGIKAVEKRMSLALKSLKEEVDELRRIKI